MNKKIAYGGLGCALSVLFIALCSYLPTGRVACLFLASLLSYLVSCMTDKKTAFIMFIAASVLGVIISPSGMLTVVMVYFICFGNYPILKHYIDLKPIGINIVLKAICYTIYAVLVYFVLTLVLNMDLMYAPYILYFIGMFLFAFYDFLLSYAGKYALGILFKRF